MKKGVIVAAAVVGALVALGASAHAAAGPLHEVSDCVACTLCEMINAFFS